MTCQPYIDTRMLTIIAPRLSTDDCVQFDASCVEAKATTAMMATHLATYGLGFGVLQLL
jgi:hypothetical protein